MAKVDQAIASEAHRRMAQILATHVWRALDHRCDRCGLGREQVIAEGRPCPHA